MSAPFHTLRREQWIARPIGEVFAFFADARNLEEITPPWLGFRILAMDSPSIQEGTRIRYRLSVAGIPMSWESRITEYADQSHFADEQVTGPYARWYHRHTFRAVTGGVEMTDHVEYTLPFGPLGRFVHWLVVRQQLRAIFDYRNKVISERFGTTAQAAPTPANQAEVAA